MGVCERCDGQRHIINPVTGLYERCACLKQEINKQKFGVFYSPTMRAASELEKLVDANCVLEAPLDALRPHVCCVMTKIPDKSIVTMDAYRILEIYLEKDDEFENSSALVDCDLLILLVGFGDPRNSYLPELVMQVLGRRDVLRLPTWVVLGIGMDRVGMKYGAELATKLSSFKRVRFE